MSNCGSNYVTLLNKKTLEEKSFPLYCDNRVCLNPDCQEHRLYKYMKEHNSQIRLLNKNMRKPKSWVFTDIKRPYPIDRAYAQKRLRLLNDLLTLSKHRKYGSSSLFSAHMEFKLNPDSWYLHFHVVSGGITNLRFVRRIWGKQIRYENAINLHDLGFYVSKYASKVPSFPNKTAYLEYAHNVYKLQMHKFSVKISSILKEKEKESDWVIINRKFSQSTNAFYELELWLNDYLNDYGFGG